MTSENTHRARNIQPAPSAAKAVKQQGSTATKTIVAVISVFILAVSGAGYATVGRLDTGMSSATDLSLGEDGLPNPSLDGAADILLVGKDSRTDAQGNPLSEKELADLHAGVAEGEENTDTIMLVRIPEDGSRATAVSIPRDTYVNDPDYGNMKINAVYASHKNDKVNELQQENAQAEARGEKKPFTDKDIEKHGVEAGREGLLKKVHSLTGVSIDHYAEVGLLGFTLLTDAVGGVEVCLNDDVEDEMSGANFHKGIQNLNGAQALTFVRQRYNLPRGDLDRIVRQQAYMASLVNKVLNSDTLTSPSKLSKIAKAVERSVVIDDGWDIMGFVTQLAGLAGGNVTFTTIPVTSIDGRGDYGESIVTVDSNEVHRFMEDLVKSHEEAEGNAPHKEENTENAPEHAADINPDNKVHVLNAGHIDGLAAGIGTWLESAGYTVERSANAQPGIYSESQVVAADADSEHAKKLAEKLGGLPVVENPQLDDTTLLVVVTDDYEGPSDEQASAEESANEVDTELVGTPGDDFGASNVSPEIDAGGDGPRCVN
ncbi:LCP family protein [Corynebacterium macginleyi]|uniref:LCP family protein n=1 Tax=Corynebacterium macginleyi TaxID=38290 RepID=UPI00190C92FB|nr:LCP family protein [Corynebacterium macginleyi]MBK4145314.1 LytR family transcriptional regulator [Corynebacterium macginleyi]MBM0261307.1 LCP family protein [Corynebacterium macginleyi]